MTQAEVSLLAALQNAAIALDLVLIEETDYQRARLLQQLRREHISPALEVARAVLTDQ